MKVLMSGGGTLGSVTPLLAVAEKLKAQDNNITIAWIGTLYGPEGKLVSRYGFGFKSITCGRWRKYFSLQNIFDIARTLVGFFQSLIFIFQFKPQIVVSAGGFVSVPVGWAAFVMRIPILIHQQDLVPGLANKLLAPFATAITVAWPEHTKYFPANKVELVGNPVRNQFINPINKSDTLLSLGLSAGKPVVLFIGGGTGAEFINKLVLDTLPRLVSFTNVIHIAGDGKSVGDTRPGYLPYALAVDNITSLLHVADLVVTRAGMGIISELSALSKPAIIIPMPNSHQEVNAQLLKSKDAAITLAQNSITNDKFVSLLRSTMGDFLQLRQLSEKIGSILPKGASQSIATIIMNIVKK